MARQKHIGSSMTHLIAIETRQRKSAIRDLMFAALVAFAAIISVSTVTSAVVAASTIAQR